MVKTRDSRLFRIVGRELPEKRLNGLWKLFELWDERLFINGRHAIESRYSFKVMFGKLQEEFSEASRAMSSYRRARDTEVKTECASKTADEIGDLVNMAGLMVPYLNEDYPCSYDDGHVPLERMILNMRRRMPDFRRVPITSFDSVNNYNKKQLFEIWLREMEGIAQQQISPHAHTLEGQKKISRVFNNNVRKAFDIIDYRNRFDDSEYKEFMNPDGPAIDALGDVVINGFIGMRELEGITYEYFLGNMCDKLIRRDERYRQTIKRQNGK